MSGKGSARSRATRWTRNTYRSAKDFFGDPTKTRSQKLKEIGGKYLKATIVNPFEYAGKKKNPLYKRIPAGAAGLLGATVATAGVIGAAGTVLKTTAIGGITRVVAPAIGAGAGLALGAVKGAYELPTRSVYGVGKALYHSPTAAVRGIKYSLAKKAFQRRTGFSNQTLSKIETLEAQKSKANTNLEDLIKKQDDKLYKINLADTKTIEKKQAKYKTQRDKLLAEIEKREAKLQKKTRKALNKSRTSKAKRGETTVFTLNANRRTVLTDEQRAKRFGILKSSGETNHDFKDRLNYKDGESIKDFSKSTGIKMFKGESEEAYKNRVGITAESNEAYGARIGVIRKEGESNDAYKNRLNSYKKKNGENNTAYLKRRLTEQYESKKEAYNAAITKDAKAKQDELKQEIGTAQAKQVILKNNLASAEQTINDYKQNPQRANRQAYFGAITKRSKAVSAIRLNELVIAQKNKKLLEAQAEEQRLMNTKSLNAKRGSMERRRTRLEESKENLTVAGKHIILPLTSAYYGAKTGYQIGTTIGQQALKYGSLGMIKEKIDSNSGKGIRKSFDGLRNLGMGKKKNKTLNKSVNNQTAKSTALGLLTGEIKTKKTIKSMKQSELGDLEIQLKQKQITLVKKITELEALKKNNPNLSIPQKVKIDNLISQLREKNSKYAKALLRDATSSIKLDIS